VREPYPFVLLQTVACIPLPPQIVGGIQNVVVVVASGKKAFGEKFRQDERAGLLQRPPFTSQGIADVGGMVPRKP
jgi:hypothetical protein